MRALAFVVLTACGRVAFDPLADAGPSNAVSDASLDDGSPVDGALSDLLLHLAFESDGLLVDRARGHSAACRGACPPTSAGRIGASAVAFSGTQCLEIFDAADLQPSTFTTAMWVNIQSPPADGEVFSRPRNGATTSNDVMEVFSASSGVFTFNAGTASIGRQVSAGAWHHVATTLDGNTFSVYIDGAMMGSMTTGALSYAPDPYLIGCERDNNVDVFRLRGAVDDFRLYDRALTGQQIAVLAAM